MENYLSNAKHVTRAITVYTR